MSSADKTVQVEFRATRSTSGQIYSILSNLYLIRLFLKLLGRIAVLHTVCLKNDTGVAHRNFDVDQPILIVFGR